MLFVPLGFLLRGSFRKASNTFESVLFGAITFVFCCAASLAVEFLQIYFPPRVPSINDVVGECLGACLGIVCWLGFGRWTVRTVRLWGNGPGDLRLLQAVDFLLVVLVQALPLDLTIHPSAIYHKYQEGLIHFVPFVSWFGDPGGLLHKAASLTVLFLPLGLISGLGGAPRFVKSKRTAFLYWFLLCGFIECIQLIVATRTADSTDVLLATLASYWGWEAGARARTRMRVAAFKDCAGCLVEGTLGSTARSICVLLDRAISARELASLPIRVALEPS